MYESVLMYFKLTFSDLTMICSPFMGELQEEVGRKVHLVRNNENTSASASYTTACMYTNTEQAKIHLVMNNNSANERLKCLCSLSHEYCCTLTLHVQSTLSTYNACWHAVTCILYPDIQHPYNSLAYSIAQVPISKLYTQRRSIYTILI